jgi:RNAse (barnase) inhibitor barstar
MKTIQLDGNKFDDLSGFYNEVKENFCPDLDGFGRNLDAFDDVLYGGFGVYGYEEKIKVIWINSQKSMNDLGYDATMAKLIEWSKSEHPHVSNEEYDRHMNEKIDELKKYKKPTLYNTIVEIIKRHEHIDFVEQ